MNNFLDYFMFGVGISIVIMVWVLFGTVIYLFYKEIKNK